MITKAMVAKWAMMMVLDKDRSSKATRKGHKHIEGKHFKSINHSGVSPAVYRNDHLVMRSGKIYKTAKSKKRGKKK